MAYCGDHRDLRIVDSLRYLFVIKCPQVLNRAATATYDQHICQPVTVCIGNGSGDFTGCFGALNSYRKKQYFYKWVVLFKDTEHIVYCCTG